MKKYDVACIGILVADILAKTVDELPEKGKLKNINEISLNIGGCASNTASDLANLGHNVCVIGKTGHDNFSDFLINKLNGYGVDTSAIHKSLELQTASSVVLVSKNGERSFLHCQGANKTLRYEDIDFDKIKNSKITFIGGTNLMPGFDGKETFKVLKKAKSLKTFTCLDTAWDEKGLWFENVEKSLPYLDLFIPSLDEACMISKLEEPEDIADFFIDKGVKICVIKLGSDGCYVKKNNDNGFYVSAFDTIEVVDTTGAGDSFVAGFLIGILNEWNLRKCAIFANAVGHFCISAPGATNGIISYEDTLEFISKNGYREDFKNDYKERT